LGLVSYVCLVRYINDHKWGAVITMLFAILAMVTVGLSKSSGDTNSLSPYQILNKGAQSLAGQYQASSLDRERRFGPGSVKEEVEFANVFAEGGGRRTGATSGNVLGSDTSGLRQRGKEDGSRETTERVTEEEKDDEDDVFEDDDAELNEAIARSLSER